jgi:hypothetical protein
MLITRHTYRSCMRSLRGAVIVCTGLHWTDAPRSCHVSIDFTCLPVCLFCVNLPKFVPEYRVQYKYKATVGFEVLDVQLQHNKYTVSCSWITPPLLFPCVHNSYDTMIIRL